MASPAPRPEPESRDHLPPGSRRRALAVRALVVLASLLMALSLVAVYARHAALDSEQFANRATAVLRNEDVRSLIAEKVTDDIVLAHQQDLLAARPIIQSAVSQIVGGGAFGGLFRTAVRDIHRAVFARDQRTVTLTVADVGTVVAVALQKLQPRIAREVRATGRVEVVRSGGERLGASWTDVAHAIRVLSVVLPLLGAGVIAGALWITPDRRRTAGDLAGARRSRACSSSSRSPSPACESRRASTGPRSAPPPARCGTRSSGTCAPRASWSPSAAPSSRRRPRRWSARWASARRCGGPLLARVRRCQEVRDHFPNLIAVNFYRRGDLFRVVDTLNGVGGD